jgi:hypothetical protein
MDEQKMMGQEMLNEVIKYVKATYETMTDNLIKVQDQGEKILKESIQKTKDLQADGEKVLNEFIENAKKGRNEFKKMMDDGFKKVEDMMKK